MQLLPHFNEAWGKSTCGKISDFLIITLLGAIIATIVTKPVSPAQAIAAGLGWTGLISAKGKN